MKAFDAAVSQPWAIQPEALHTLLDIARRTQPADIEAASRRMAERDAALEPESVSALPGTLLEGSRRARLRGSTAVIPIEGPVFRYANLMTELSGATSIEMLAQDFQTALSNPNVNAILLHVDSPGGQANGTGEFADMIYTARGTKPITAYVSNLGASAAYWIASAADKIVVAPSAILGSIGVAMVIEDPKQQDGKEIELVSSQSPNKRPNVATKEGRALIQATVDALADVFVESVARNRGVSVQTVLEQYGAGDVLVGANAVNAGLADALGSFEQCLIDIQNADATVAASPPIQVQPASPERRRRPMSGISERFDNLMALLNGTSAAVEGDMDEGESPPVVRAVATVARQAATAAPDPQLIAERQAREALQQRLDAAEAENRRIRAERISELATAFAERQIVAGRAFPAEQAQIVAMYTQLATIDADLGPRRQADGSTTTLVAGMTAAYEARPSHNLTKEQMSAVTTAQALQTLANIERTPGVGEGPADQAELDKMLAMTPGGRATLAARRNGGSH